MTPIKMPAIKKSTLAYVMDSIFLSLEMPVVDFMVSVTYIVSE